MRLTYLWITAGPQAPSSAPAFFFLSLSLLMLVQQLAG